MHSRSRLSRSRFASSWFATLALAGMVAFPEAALHAAEVTWTGSSSNNWGIAGNYSPSGVPTASDLVVIDTTSNAVAMGPGGGGPLHIGAFWLRVGTRNQTLQPLSSGTGSPDTTLYVYGYETEVGGNMVNLLFGNTSGAALTFQDRGNPVVPLPVQLKGSGVVYADSTINLNVVVTDDGTPRSITKQGGGELVFSKNTNSFSGGLILEDGLLRSSASSVVSGGVLVSSPFGTGALTLRSGTIGTQTTMGRTYANAVVLDGGATFGMDSVGVGVITISSNAGKTTTIAKDSTINVLTRVVWNQAIDGDYSLTKTGVGALILGGNNNYSGTTYVAGGQLLVNGSLNMSSVEVQSGGRLGGTGSISQNVTVHAGGTLTAGQYETVGEGELDSRGTLTLYGNVELQEGSYLEFRLDSASSYDSICLQGDILISGAELKLVLGYVPEQGDTFVLLLNDGFSTLEGLNYNGRTLLEGDTFLVGNQMFSISYAYDGSSLAVVAIPEAGSLLFLGAGFGVLACRNRRGKGGRK